MSKLSDYDYELPEHLIAQTPLEERTGSRLLHLDRQTGEIMDRKFVDLETILAPGDLLVLNDTRVTARRLKGTKSTGGFAEALLLRRVGERRYLAMTKPAKRLRIGVEIEFEGDLLAEVVELLDEGYRILEFRDSPSLEQRLQVAGSVPLPPYIRAGIQDEERYQTVIAKEGGSAAAPTAALHFTSEFLQKLENTGIQLATVTLEVGIDTFRPVQTDDLRAHQMHGERCVVPIETASKIEACQGRIIAVGTTTVRTLETMAVGKRAVEAGMQVSKLFIQPGFKFQVVDGMLTNFHLPKTTMLMMISAMSTRNHIQEAYQHAVREGYRFLSFGDSMLIL